MIEIPQLRGYNFKTYKGEKPRQLVREFHIKPIHYFDLSGNWQPLDEIAYYYGNRGGMTLKEGWEEKVDFNYLVWYLKRQQLIKGKGIMLPTRVPLLVAATLTAFPNSGTGVTAVDGHAGYNGQNVTFATIRAGTSANNSSDTATTFNCIIRTAAGSPNFSEMWRCIACFDTSSLTSAASISAATLSFFGGGKDTTLGGGISVTSFTGSATAVATGSYNISNYADTKLATDITLASWSTSAYNDYALNASGLTNISKVGVSKFALRTSFDVENIAPSHPGSQQYSYVQPSTADETGTSQDPKLVITYTLGTASKLTLLGVS